MRTAWVVVIMLRMKQTFVLFLGLTAILGLGCGLVKPKASSELEGDVPFRVVNHSKDKIHQVIITREASASAPRAFRNVVGDYAEIRTVEPGKSIETTIRGGVYSISLEAYGYGADYNRSTGSKAGVDCSGPCEIVYEDRPVEGADHEKWKQIVLVNSETPDESKRSSVTFVNRCPRPIETLTRNYGSRPHGHGNLGGGMRDREPVSAYGSVGFIDPVSRQEVWTRIEAGTVTVAITEACNAIAVVPAGAVEPTTTKPRR